MRFLNLRLQNFRNIAFTELGLKPERSFLLGQNGEGKSNLLEALGLVMALRSFRTQSMEVLRRQGADNYMAVYEIEHDIRGRTELEIRSDSVGREVLLDGEKVTHLGDFIGHFPVVALSSGDLMLLRGSPAERRRFLDITLSVVDREYYHALRHYHRGIAGRNRLLKKGGSDSELSAFESEVAPYACMIVNKRRAEIGHLHEILVKVYSNIAETDEGPSLYFKPSFECEDVAGFRNLLEQQRVRDRIIGATQKGPHRDDFSLRLKSGGAREYASDGQQRGLCVALRIAQARLFEARLGVSPVLLADDVLGELDPLRKAGFWRACPDQLQIVATGTELPEEADEWAIWEVRQGRFNLR